MLKNIPKFALQLIINILGGQKHIFIEDTVSQDVSVFFVLLTHCLVIVPTMYV